MVSYHYDEADNVTLFTDSAAKETRYRYDQLNRVDITTPPSGGTVDYDWIRDSLLSRVSYGTRMSRVYGYDDADRITSITNSMGGAMTRWCAVNLSDLQCGIREQSLMYLIV